MSDFFQRCISGISPKDFIPPVCGKVSTKFRNFFHVAPAQKRSGHFLYLPEDYSPDFVLDIGAATGFTAFAALQSFDSIPVHCVEPMKENVEILKKSIALFPDRAFIHNVAVSDSIGEMELNIMNSPYANSLFELPAQYGEDNPQVKVVKKQLVRVETLDSLAEKINVSGNGLVKIDVEGAELNVLNGGEKFIREHVSAVIIELAFNRGTTQINNVMDKLRYYGFELSNVFDVAWSRASMNRLEQLDAVYLKK